MNEHLGEQRIDVLQERIAELEAGIDKAINLLRENNHIDARAALLMLKTPANTKALEQSP